MLMNHSGVQLFPLKTGSGTVANLTAGGQVAFDMTGIPVYNQSLAYYIPALIFTLKGALTQSGGTGVALYWDNLLRAILASVEVQGAWHGTPFSAGEVSAAMLPIVEFIGNGGRYVGRRRGRVPAANGTYNFNYTFALPLSCGYGQKPHHTSQLALFYQGAQVISNVAAASVLTAASPGGSLASLTLEVSAVMLPEPELRLGAGIEWVDYQQAAASGQSSFQINDFGARTRLSGVEKGAGIIFHGLLTNVNGLPGCFAAQNLTQFQAVYRNQVSLNQIDALVAMCIDALGENRPIGGAVDQAAAQGLSDTNGFPYAMGTDHSNSLENRTGLLFFPVGAMPTPDLEFSKLQTVSDPQTIEATISSISGTMHQLVQQAKSWEPTKIEEAARKIVDSGLAMRVLGTSDVEWALKVIKKQSADEISAKKLRFFPLTLKPRGADADAN